MYYLKDNALTTLDTLKNELGIKPTDESDEERDKKLCRKINTYSDLIENVTGRIFKLQTYTEKYQGSNTQTILLNNKPVTNIVSVTQDGETIESTEYQLLGKHDNKRRLFKNSGWKQSSYGYLMTPQRKFGDFDIEITYEAGYILPYDENYPEKPRTLPYDIENAILTFICVDMSQEGSSQGLKGFKISDVSWDFGNPFENLTTMKQMSPKAYNTILTYRNRVLV